MSSQAGNRVTGAYNKLNRHWRFESFGHLLSVGTDTRFPGPYGPNRLTKAGLSPVSTGGPFDMSVAPRYMAVSFVLPSVVA